MKKIILIILCLSSLSFAQEVEQRIKFISSDGILPKEQVLVTSSAAAKSEVCLSAGTASDSVEDAILFYAGRKIDPEVTIGNMMGGYPMLSAQMGFKVHFMAQLNEALLRRTGRSIDDYRNTELAICFPGRSNFVKDPFYSRKTKLSDIADCLTCK